MKKSSKFFFDYIYFRVAEVYFKWDGKNGVTAVFAVSLIQSLLFLCVLGTLYKTILSPEITSKLHGYSKWISFALVGFLSIYNYQKFKGKYFFYKSYWKDENKKVRRIKGLLVLLSLIIPWIPIVLLGTIFK